MKPFTQEDLDALNKSEEEAKYCETCVHEKSCITLQLQNKLSLHKNGYGVSDIWGCSIHKTEDEALEEEIKNEEEVTA